MTTTNAAVVRDSHTAVWTGSEMMVWGGWGGPGCQGKCMLDSGGRYIPETDTWSAMSTANAPAARWDQKAFWTGSEMIVWGGTDQTNYLHTGGIYNPATDSWTPTSLVNAPPGRFAFRCSMDGKPNDCVGRGRRSNLYRHEYGWQLQSKHRQLGCYEPRQRALCPGLSHRSVDGR